jgi:hypothetical protein
MNGKPDPECEFIFPGTAVNCPKTATVFADVTVNEIPILGFRCDTHQATPDEADASLAAFVAEKQQAVQVH